MLNVSAAWQAESIAQFRYPAYLKCTIQVTPPGIEEGAAVTNSNTFSKSNVSAVIDGHDASPQPFATLEHNRWVLSGIFDLMEDDTETTDWWSEDSSETTLQFVFDSIYTIPGIYIEWDLVNETFPSKVIFIGYDSNHQAVSTVTVTDISSASGYIAMPMENIKYLDVTIESWSLPSWKFRMNSIVFGFSASLDSINNGRINSATTTDTSSLLSAELPKHAISITLRNHDLYLDPTRHQGLARYLTAKQVAKVKWGFTTSPGNIEWSDSLVYLVDSIEIPSESREAVISFSSRLDLLTDTFTEGNYTGSDRTFKDLAEYVLQHSGILKTKSTEVPWIIPSVLEEYVTNAPIPAQSINSILQLVAGATATMLTTYATNGFVQFKVPSSSPTDLTPITEKQALGDPKVELAQPLKSITVGLYSYTPETTQTDIGTFQAVLNGTQTLRVQYNVAFAQNVAATITGGTLVSATYYASYAVLVITGTGAEITITLKGYEIKQNVTYIQTFSDANVVNGLNVQVDNPLITNKTVLDLVSEAAKSYYRLRDKYQISYLGYPQLEVGDCIKLSSIYEQDASVVVEQNNLTFNGGWNGTVKVV